MVNPVPYDLLLGECDLVVAVKSTAVTPPRDSFTFMEAFFISVRIMQQAILDEKMARVQPDLLIDTGVTGARMLEFHKADIIYEQAAEAKASLIRQLPPLVEAFWAREVD
jgi:NTE family protein